MLLLLPGASLAERHELIKMLAVITGHRLVVRYWQGAASAVDPITAPPDTAYILPPQCDIFMQMHFHRNGKQEVDRSKLGLWLTKKPPTKFIKSYLVDTTFTIIPAGVKKYKATGSRVLEEDIKLFTFSPHAHRLATESRLYYSLPGSIPKQINGFP